MKILLIHGLSRSPLSLLSLELKLKRSGYTTEQFGYLAVTESFESIVRRLCQRLQRLASQGAYGIVAHSLGGLLTRVALSRHRVRPPEHIVMLGTPNQPPRLAAFAWRLPPFRWISGQCGFNLSRPDFFMALPSLDIPYTLIAGTGGPRGLLSPFGDELNDGIVALSETRLKPTDAIAQLPVWHTFMMNDPAVQQTVLQSLVSSS
ncbi:MAG: alpha/beta hydrolase [Leptolyngbya sp. SIO4C5]|nr:alpha/beta hydrolase [Leptolyngbya sp. SIO4C5]